MTKEEFKLRWESNDKGGGITFDDIAHCAKDWDIFTTPQIHDINKVMDKVVEAAGCEK